MAKHKQSGVVVVKIVEEKYLQVDADTAAKLIKRTKRGTKADRAWVEEVVGDYDGDMCGHTVQRITKAPKRIADYMSGDAAGD
jgi:hypothetical protein